MENSRFLGHCISGTFKKWSRLHTVLFVSLLCSGPVYSDTINGELNLGTWNTGSSGASSNGATQLLVSGQHNQGVNNGTSSGTYKVKIEGYNNDGPIIYPLFVRDENGLVDFWLKNRPSASGKPTMFFDGNFGLGTTNAQTKFDLRGNMSIGWRGPDTSFTNNSERSILFFSKGANSSAFDYLHDAGRIYAGNTSYDVDGVGGGWANQSLVLEAGNTWGGYVDWQLVLKGDGNVGIGTATPNNKLDVNGTIRAKEVIVETNWSDFVFEEGYQLRSLDEVEEHIANFGHLPDVPSAKLIQEEGLSVAASQTIMMQKIEELTLYILKQQKELEQQRSEIELLKSKL